jgi:hypothetical protein
MIGETMQRTPPAVIAWESLHLDYLRQQRGRSAPCSDTVVMVPGLGLRRVQGCSAGEILAAAALLEEQAAALRRLLGDETPCAQLLPSRAASSWD